MLSKENIEKLHTRGVYSRDPIKAGVSPDDQDVYWCKNWTYTVQQTKDGKYYMKDTYWLTGGYYEELTDKNFDEFEFLFDLDDIRYVYHYKDWLSYPDDEKWCVPLDSGGKTNKRYVVKKGSKKIKDRVVERLQEEINDMRRQVAHKERVLEGIIDGSINYDLY